MQEKLLLTYPYGQVQEKVRKNGQNKFIFLEVDHVKSVTYSMSLASWWLAKSLRDTHAVGLILNAHSVTELCLFNHKKWDAHFVTSHLCDCIADPLLSALPIDFRTQAFQRRFIWVITTNCNLKNSN